jgi:hypothetical protein
LTLVFETNRTCFIGAFASDPSDRGESAVLSLGARKTNKMLNDITAKTDSLLEDLQTMKNVMLTDLP